MERPAGQPPAEHVGRIRRSEVQRADTLGQRHARQPLIGSQEPNRMRRPRLGLVVSGGLQNQAVGVGSDRRADVQVPQVAVRILLECGS